MQNNASRCTDDFQFYKIMYNLGIPRIRSCSAADAINVLYFYFPSTFLPFFLHYLPKLSMTSTASQLFQTSFFSFLSVPYYISYSMSIAFVVQILETIEVNEV